MLSSSSRRTVALLVLGVVMAAIFAADTLTDYAVAAACFYAAVILAASRVLSGRGLVRLAALCIGLTGLSFFLTRFGTYRIGLVNSAIGMLVIGITTWLALKWKPPRPPCRTRRPACCGWRAPPPWASSPPPSRMK